MKKAGIVAFAFGTPHTTGSNQGIAHIASQNSKKLGAAIYTQLDVRIGPEIKDVEYVENDRFGNPPPTLRVARGAVLWAKKREFTDLWIVAARPHLWQVVRDIKRAMRELEMKIIFHICEEVWRYLEDEWFCPDSTQAHTRSQKKWRVREFILRIMPFFIYKRVAG